MLSAIGDLASSIDIWNDNVARLPKPAEGEEEDEETAEKRQEYLDLVDKAKKKIEKINKLHSSVTRFRTTPAQRTIGFVPHAEPIAVSDGPHKFTRSNSTRRRSNGTRSWATKSILVRFPSLTTISSRGFS